MSNTQQLPCLVIPEDRVEFEAQSTNCFRVKVVSNASLPNVFLDRDSQLILLNALAANLGRTVTEEQEAEEEVPSVGTDALELSCMHNNLHPPAEGSSAQLTASSCGALSTVRMHCVNCDRRTLFLDEEAVRRTYNWLGEVLGIEAEKEEPTEDAMNITATETADAEGPLFLPCRSNRSGPGGLEEGDFLWSLRRPVGLDTAGDSMQMAVVKNATAHVPLLDRVFLERQSVINLTVQLTDWLFDTQQEGNTQEGADECSKPSTNDSSQDTASPSESSASNSELMAEMVSQIVLCFAQEVVSALSNSSSRASSCDPSNDCGDSC